MKKKLTKGELFAKLESQKQALIEAKELLDKENKRLKEKR